MKLLYLFFISIILTACTQQCKYNEYLPENNPLIIPEDLKPNN